MRKKREEDEEQRCKKVMEHKREGKEIAFTSPNVSLRPGICTINLHSSIILAVISRLLNTRLPLVFVISLLSCSCKLSK